MPTETEMPKYRCHKEVWALKIKAVKPEALTTGAVLVFEEDGYAPMRVPQGFIDKHDPQPGGYFVQYKDGYQSFSPAKAFEEGYTRI